MTFDIDDAIENARSAGLTREPTFGRGRPIHSANMVRAIVSAFLRDLPEHLSAHEILESLAGG